LHSGEHYRFIMPLTLKHLYNKHLYHDSGLRRKSSLQTQAK